VTVPFCSPVVFQCVLPPLSWLFWSRKCLMPLQDVGDRAPVASVAPICVQTPRQPDNNFTLSHSLSLSKSIDTMKKSGLFKLSLSQVRDIHCPDDGSMQMEGGTQDDDE
jgi:hypothetical protein